MMFIKQKLRELRVAFRRWSGAEPRVPVSVRIPLEYHGTVESGWCIAASSLDRQSQVVDVGLGEDVTFSESLISRYGLTVAGFDPTPRAVAYVTANANPRLRLFELGVGAKRGSADFYLPNDPRHVSGSVSPHSHLGREKTVVNLITVGDLFGLLGCDHIDLLKLDIEGAEYDVINSSDFRAFASRIGQLCVEFHHRWADNGPGSTYSSVKVLEELGFHCAWYSPTTNEEFLFVRQPSLNR